MDVLPAMSNTQRSATWAPYRSTNLTSPEAITDDELVEVTLSWGDDVLSVSHLRRGESFSHGLSECAPGAELRVRRAECCEVSVPEGASAWLIREGRIEDQRASFALPRDAMACVERGVLTLKVRRVAPPAQIERARPVTAFAAATACALALATSGAAWASSLDDDSETPIATLRADPHPWIIAHVTALANEAPPPQQGDEGVMIGRSPVVRRAWPGRSPVVRRGWLCGCALSPPWPFDADVDDPVGAPSSFDPSVFVGMPFEASAPPTSTVHVGRVRGRDATRASEIRYGLDLRRNEIAACNAEPRRASGRVTLRLVVTPNGSVIAAGVTSSTHPSAAVASCIERSARAWRFTPTSKRELSAVEVPLTLR